MSRSGYSYDCENLELYRQAVNNAINGKRGQEFLRDLLTALDEMPVKELIEGTLEESGQVCALGALARKRGLQTILEDDWEWNHKGIAKMFNIASSLAQEVMYENDEGAWKAETPEQRWKRMREWAVEHIKPSADTK